MIERLGEIAGPDAIYVAGVGQHQMWAAQFISYENPGTWLNSGGARHDGLRGAGRDGRQGRPAGRDGLGDRRRRLLPDDQPGARHLRASRASRSRSPSSTTATSAWSGSGRRCSTTSATPTPTSARHKQPHPRLREARRGARLRRAALRDQGRRRRDDREGDGDQRRAGRRRLRRRQGRAWCGRWSPPAPATTRSWSPATCGPSSTRMGRG